MHHHVQSKVHTRISAWSSAHVTMYCDASESGYGIVVFNLCGVPMRIFGGPWSTCEAKLHINILELRSLRGVRIIGEFKQLDTMLSNGTHIDNTSARAWAIRKRAPKWFANQLVVELDDDLNT
jgi:hypothetical protein